MHPSGYFFVIVYSVPENDEQKISFIKSEFHL
jgi:hypothetical protein